MKCSITVICETELAVGFALSGVEAIGISSSDKARETLVKILAIKKEGLIFISDKIMKLVPEHMCIQLEESSMPLFSVLPISIKPLNKTYEEQAWEHVNNMIKHAIGRKIEVNTLKQTG